jgi:hypothetical protein
MEPTTNIIEDLRLLEAPHPWPFWVWLALASGAILIACLVVRYRRAQRNAPPRPTDPAVAVKDALDELAAARTGMDPAQSRAYAILVSGIVRRYIEARFGIQAPKRSTEEFLVEARQAAPLAGLYGQLLQEFLGCCDFLKFAQATADLPELEKLHAAAVKFVTETRQVGQPGGMS